MATVNRASRTDRKGSLTVAFNQVTVNGRSYLMRGTPAAVISVPELFTAAVAEYAEPDGFLCELPGLRGEKLWDA